MFQRLAETPVTPEDVRTARRASHPEEMRSKVRAGEMAPNVLAAVMLRLEALSRLLSTEALNSLPEDALLHATAEARLMISATVEFDADDFRSIALRHSQSEGSA